MKKYIVSMSISTALLLFLGGILLILVPNTIDLYANGDGFTSDKMDNIEYCEREYQDKEYGWLYRNMIYDNCTSEEFDKYWEIVNGYLDYCQYRQWSNVDESELPGCTDKAEEYKQKVMENAENAKFSQNKKRLAEFAEEIE